MTCQERNEGGRDGGKKHTETEMGYRERLGDRMKRRESGGVTCEERNERRSERRARETGDRAGI